MLLDIFCINTGFAFEARPPGHTPRELLGIIKPGGATRDKDMRNFLQINVLLDRGFSCRPDNVEKHIYLVRFHKFANLLDRLWRIEAVVVGNEIDFSAVDAALIVDHFEVGGFGLANSGVSRCWPAVRHYIADFDLGIAYADVVLLLRDRRAGASSNDQSR